MEAMENIPRVRPQRQANASSCTTIAVQSHILRLPNEMLLEIFQHVCPPTKFWGPPPPLVKKLPWSRSTPAAVETSPLYQEERERWHNFYNLCLVSKRFNEVARETLYQFLPIGTELQLARAIRTVMEQPGLSKMVKVLDCSVALNRASKYEWRDLQCIVSQRDTRYDGDDSDAVRFRNIILGSVPQNMALGHRPLLGALVCAIPNLQTFRFELPHTAPFSKCNFSASLGPLFFGEPMNSNLLLGEPLFSAPDNIQAQPSQLMTCSCLPAINSSFICKKCDKEMLRAHWPLSNVRNVVVDLPRDGPEHTTGTLTLHVTPPAPSPAIFTPMWTRVTKLTITSTMFFLKLLGMMSNMPSLQILEAKCFNLARMDYVWQKVIPGPDLFDGRTSPHIDDQDEVYCLSHALQQVRDTLTNLELDIYVNSAAARDIYGRHFGIYRLVNLETLSSLTELTLTLTGAFEEAVDLRNILSDPMYTGDELRRQKDVLGRFPTSLHSLTIIEFWEDNPIFDPASGWAAGTDPDEWIQLQKEEFLLMKGLMTVIAAGAGLFLPKLRKVHLVTPMIPHFFQDWEPEVDLKDAQGYVWDHWTKHMSEEGFQQIFNAFGSINFTMAIRHLEPDPCITRKESAQWVGDPMYDDDPDDCWDT